MKTRGLSMKNEENRQAKDRAPRNTNMAAREGRETRRLEVMELSSDGTVILKPLTELLSW